MKLNGIMPYDIVMTEVQRNMLELHPNHIHYNEGYCNSELHYWTPIMRLLRKRIEEGKVERCLDIGCMVGTLLAYAKTLNPKIDVYSYNLIKFISDECMKKYDIKFHQGNIETQPFYYEGKFDVIIMTEIVEHFKWNIVPTIIKVVEHLSDDGVLYISTPNAANPEWGRLGKYNSWKDIPQPIINDVFVYDLGHEYQYLLDEMLEVFDQCGLEVSSLDYVWYNFNFELKKKKI
jgi:SAM-dependent methyltransferase